MPRAHLNYEIWLGGRQGPSKSPISDWPKLLVREVLPTHELGQRVKRLKLNLVLTIQYYTIVRIRVTTLILLINVFNS